MTIRSLAARGAMSVALACAALATAHAAPPQFTKLRAQVTEVAGSTSAAGVDYSFRLQSYVDFDGSRRGSVFIEAWGGVPFYQFVLCDDTSFADAVAMNQSTGVLNVAATVDPAGPGCQAYLYEGPPLTVRLSGQSNSNYRKSDNGNGVETMGGQTFRYNFNSDTFESDFSGSIGLYTGMFTGRSTAARAVNRARVQ